MPMPMPMPMYKTCNTALLTKLMKSTFVSPRKKEIWRFASLTLSVQTSFVDYRYQTDQNCKPSITNTSVVTTTHWLLGVDVLVDCCGLITTHVALLVDLQWAFAQSKSCDRIWENPLYGIFFSENWVWYMVNKLYHRANLHSSFRPIVRFVVEIQCFVCDCTTPPIIEKLQSKGIAMHAYGVSAYHVWTRNQLQLISFHLERVGPAGRSDRCAWGPGYRYPGIGPWSDRARNSTSNCAPFTGEACDCRLLNARRYLLEGPGHDRAGELGGVEFWKKLLPSRIVCGQKWITSITCWPRWIKWHRRYCEYVRMFNIFLYTEMSWYLSLGAHLNLLRVIDRWTMPGGNIKKWWVKWCGQCNMLITGVWGGSVVLFNNSGLSRTLALLRILHRALWSSKSCRNLLNSV